MNTNDLILDLRKTEKRNIIIRLIFLPAYIFLGEFLNLKNNTWIPFLYFLFLEPALKFFGVKCPKCNQGFYKKIYFFTEVNKEKERTSCINCNYSPKIYSDYLPTDYLSNQINDTLIDLRNTEKNIFFIFFTALVFAFITWMILFFTLKNSLSFDTNYLAYGLVLFYFTVCYISISSTYKKTICPKCNNKFFQGIFGFLKARKLIKESKCACCGKTTFIRSYIYGSETTN